MKTFSTLRRVTLLLIIVTSFSAHAQVKQPRTPSPAASITQTIGISTVTVKYSRPSVKGRDVWGKLVPYGWNVQPGYGAQNSSPWRAGANENTTIEFSHPAKIGGELVPAGLYGLFFVINQDNSGEVILSKDNKAWGSFWYDATRDQLDFISLPQSAGITKCGEAALRADTSTGEGNQFFSHHYFSFRSKKSFVAVKTFDQLS